MKIKIPALPLLLVSLVGPLIWFMNSRVVRMAGDEKVYVAQAIEMSRRGTWFFQSLADIPYYYKGPFHYWMLRLGMILFGNSMAASIWMNVALLCLLIILAYRVFKNAFPLNQAILLTSVMGFNLGILSHAFASQMEVELHFFYCLSFLILFHFKNQRGLWLFWITLGITSWVKSPFQSVQLAAGAFLFWTWEGTLVSKLRSPLFWGSLLSGTFLGLAGYAPILLSDFDVFWNSYIQNEHLHRPNNNGGIQKTTLPLVHFSIPWLLIAVSGFINRAPHFNQLINTDRTTRLALSLSMPTIIYWAFSPSQGQNYSLPALSLLLIAMLAKTESFTTLQIWSARITGLIGAIVACALILVWIRFSPMPEWWSRFDFGLTLVSMGIFSIAFLIGKGPRSYLIGSFGFMMAFLSLARPLGEHELDGLKIFQTRYPNAKLIYFNPSRIIFAEWGLLQLATGKEFYIAQDFGALDKKSSLENAVIVPDGPSLDELKKYLKDRNQAYEMIRWKKWWAKGKSNTGETLWDKAWNERDMSYLEREIYIIYFKHNDVPT